MAGVPGVDVRFRIRGEKLPRRGWRDPLATCADAVKQRFGRKRDLCFRRSDFKSAGRQAWRGLYQKSLAQWSFDQGRRSFKKYMQLKN
jgi:hypothetical protein